MRKVQNLIFFVLISRLSINFNRSVFLRPIRLNGYAFLIAILLTSSNLLAQDYPEYPYPKDAFTNPLGIDWKLSGTFGEPRGNHFHAGADVKTNGATGYNLYSIADGYVSRIKVSPYGYGKALYIAHPNGYTSVYGHMSKFNDEIDSLITYYQYATQEFAQDIYLDYGKVTLKQGQVIGLSGNSGGSGGPHLHFEIRQTASQRPINPLFFGYKVDDNKPPHISGFKLTELKEGSSYYDVRGKRYDLVKEGSKYVKKDTISVKSGRLLVGVHGYDQQTLTTNKNGIFRMEMYVDGESVFKWTIDETSFDQGRYVNAFRDFFDRKYNRTIYNCFRLPGNYLDVYEYLVDDGYVKLKTGEIRKVNIDVFDFHKNKSEIEFYVKKVDKEVTDNKADSSLISFKYDQNNSINNSDFKAFFPKGAFYDDVKISYEKVISTNKSLHSDIYKVHDYLIPLHKSSVFQVAPKNIPNHLKSKAIIVHKDLKGIDQTLSTFWKDGMVTAKCKEVGWFYIKLDTLKPEIKLLNFNSKTKTFRGNKIRVKINDQLSGVEKYSGYIDNHWVVFDYDAKRNIISFDFDEYSNHSNEFDQRGEHFLRIIVIDDVGNEASFERTFVH